MAVTKTDVVSVRVPPDIKAVLVAAAQAERRSIASMVEVLVLDYWRSKGMAPTPEAVLASASVGVKKKTAKKN